VAKNRTTSTSDGPNTADKAVDGKRNKKQCVVTTVSKDPWWQVDLEYIYTVEEIVITSRSCRRCGKLNTL